MANLKDQRSYIKKRVGPGSGNLCVGFSELDRVSRVIYRKELAEKQPGKSLETFGNSC